MAFGSSRAFVSQYVERLLMLARALERDFLVEVAAVALMQPVYLVKKTLAVIVRSFSRIPSADSLYSRFPSSTRSSMDPWPKTRKPRMPELTFMTAASMPLASSSL